MNSGGVWSSLIGWLLGRYRRHRPGSYTYRRSIGPLLTTILVVLFVEGTVVEVVLVAVLSGTPWPWISLALHIYGMCWVAGYRASLYALPHRLGERELVLYDGVHARYSVPYSAIRRARPWAGSHTGRTGLIGAHTGVATLAYGDTSIRLELRPDAPIQRRRGEPITGIRSLDITVDTPHEFVADLSARLTSE